MCYKRIFCSSLIHFLFALILCNFALTLLFHLETIQWTKCTSALCYASVTTHSNIPSMKENRNSSKHVETEGSGLLLLSLTLVRSDTDEFRLGGVGGREQVLDFHMCKCALFEVLILQNRSSDNLGSRITLAKSAVGAMHSWEMEVCGMNPPGTITPWKDKCLGVVACWSNPSGAWLGQW